MAIQDIFLSLAWTSELPINVKSPFARISIMMDCRVTPRLRPSGLMFLRYTGLRAWKDNRSVADMCICAWVVEIKKKVG
ncbi:hypothetical protein PNOK_0397000 [Pyrrhoderma noxium]|uniref:Uncharacterized protein n=1 Tax=Pyrrhoderma noxium TaxID=2282107 RepID=A0A286UP26_9AGAM|nr:hypothetical protein PNOK_0397000 [Pyrrhoderma noxium]